VEPGLFGTPKAKHLDHAKQIAWSTLIPAERTRLLAMVSGISASAGAPWTPLPNEVRDASRRALLGTTANRSVQAFLDGAFEDVLTAQDLRGLAVIVGRSLDARI
jgi:hypothetical protein